MTVNERGHRLKILYKSEVFLDESITIVLDDREILSGVCGANDGNLKVIEGSLGGRIAARGNEIRLTGADDAGLQRFRTVMDNLIAMVKEGENPSVEYVRALTGSGVPSDDGFIHIPHGFGRVHPRSKNHAFRRLPRFYSISVFSLRFAAERAVTHGARLRNPGADALQRGQFWRL